MSGVRIPPPRPLFFGQIATVEVLGKAQSVVAVAHQVEHRIVAPEVVGSRPISHPITALHVYSLRSPSLALKVPIDGCASNKGGRRPARIPSVNALHLLASGNLNRPLCVFAIQVDLEAGNGVYQDNRLNFLFARPVDVREAL